MRLRLPVRWILLAAALMSALALTATACSSGSSSSTSGPTSSSRASASSPAPSSPATSASSSSSTGGNTAAATTIAASWEAFFNGKTSAAKKIALLQNGSKFAAIINAQAGSSLASSAGAKVTAVVLNSSTTATVSYDITLNGTTTLSNQTGTAVYEDGTWKVGDVSFCQLLKLENGGDSPSVCG